MTPVLAALRSDYPALRTAAAKIVNKALKEDAKKGGRDRPVVAVMNAFGVSRNTAREILRARKGWMEL